MPDYIKLTNNFIVWKELNFVIWKCEWYVMNAFSRYKIPIHKYDKI